jgi:hypothetical protein
MPNYIAMLLAALEAYALCDRYPELDEYRMLAQMGLLSQDQAQLLLYQLQDVVEHLRDFPNTLHRSPAEGQLFEQGRPDITVGHLVEDEQIRIGLRLGGKVPHVLAAGSTGSGKTSLFRVIIDRVESLNAQSISPTDKPDHH